MKSEIMRYAHKIHNEIEQDHFNYVVNMIDWMLLDRLEITKEIIDQFLIEVSDIEQFNPDIDILYSLIEYSKELLRVKI